MCSNSYNYTDTLATHKGVSKHIRTLAVTAFSDKRERESLTHLVTTHKRRFGRNRPVALCCVEICVTNTGALKLDEALPRFEIFGPRDWVVVSDLE